MIEFGGVFYYIDLDALDNVIAISGSKSTDKYKEIENKFFYDNKNELVGSEKRETTIPKGKEINGPKYEVIIRMIEVLIDFDDEIDDSLGADRAFSKTPIAYKLAFNTLFNCGVLKEKE